jgi:hypothetical protein
MKKYSRTNIGNKGFVLVLSILMLLIMSIAGVTMVTLVAGEFNENERRDHYQQTLYAAETAINQGKVWLKKANLPSLSTSPTAWTGGGVSSWCPASLFVELPRSNNFVIKDAGSAVDLNSILKSTDDAEKQKFSQYELFWFVAYPSVWNGSQYVNNTRVVATSDQNANNKSGSIDENSSKVNKSGSTGFFYTVYACARKKPGFFEKSPVVALDVLVKATQ